VALFALGLLLTAQAPFNPCGGLMDFRIDFIASCLFGTFLCAALRARLFASRRWSADVGGIAALLVLFRSVTAAYLAGILGALFLAVCAGLWLYRRDAEARRRLWRRLGGLVMAGLVLVLLAAPVLWLNRAAIRAYYVGHLSSGESQERNHEFGVYNTVDRLLFYPRSVLRDHAGPGFQRLAGLALASAVVVGRFRRPAGAAGDPRRVPGAWAASGFAGACLVVPVAILTLYESPSPVVGNVVVTALVWLAVVLTVWLARLRGASGDGREREVWGYDGQLPGQTARTLPAKLVAGGGSYAITLDLQSADLPDEPAVVIRLSFDSEFCPRERIPGCIDGRRPVIKAPSLTRLLPAP
jgi:hypothetical protein